MRSAGDDAHFRTIDRFPEEGSEEGDGEADELELVVSEKLAEAIQRGDWSEAKKAAGRRIGEERPAHAFLDGYIAWKRERWKEARRSFDAAAANWGRLTDYASYYGAAASLEAGEAHEAVVRAARVPSSSRLFGDALSVMTRALLESGGASDQRRARRVAGRYLEHFPDGEHAARMRLELMRLNLGEQAWQKAVDRAFSLLERDPLSDEAEEADELLEAHLEEFPEALREEVEPRPRELQMAYLEALYERHRSEKVIEEATERLESWTPGGRPRCRAMYWTGRSHTKLRRHEEATDWYDRILDECAGVQPFERNALYVGGKSYWNAGQKREALGLFEQLWTDYDDHSFADDGMYFAARIHRELDQNGRAMELLGRQVDRYPDGDMAADAHWLRVRAMIRDEDWKQVVAYVDSLDDTGEGEPYTRGRLAYYRARALQARGETDRAREQYRDVAESHPLRLYALLALSRLAKLDGVPPGEDVCAAKARLCEQMLEADGDEEAETFVPSLPGEVREASHFRRGAALLRLGLREWAHHEFDRLFEQFSGKKRPLLALADLLDRAGAHEFAYGLPDRVDGWRERYPDESNRRPWEIAYPRAYRSIVERWAGKRDLAASFVWAIVRKESGYNAGIESWANARGLMQLMEPTAESVADRIGVGGLLTRDWLAAETNVRLGTAYLDELGDQLGDHPALMAAGYNGGMGNVSEWLDEHGDRPLDLWLEDIPYGQTRRYAKVVLANDWAYRWVYGGREVPRLTFDLSEIAD